MKIDRLLAIITYLLNHDLVTGKYLAEKFGVSERTIQRDVDTINLSGVPILSLRGIHGGYKILDTYRLSKQTATEKDLQSISLALSSLNSALEDERISNTLEKIISITPSKPSPNIHVDFGVARENKKVIEYIKRIEEAILNRLRIELSYTNADNHTTTRVIEPVSLKFKWYSWYLVAYCTEKNQYRIFKLVRITSLRKMDTHFTNKHEQKTDLFDALMSLDNRRTIDIIFKCRKTISTAVSEYLPGVKFTETAEDYLLGELTAPENERMWFAFMLSFGDDIEVLEPKALQRRLVEHSQKIIKSYKIPDA